ncbi:MAG: ABC transporter ATP-binding protein, partial [Acidobacteriota bacterium]
MAAQDATPDARVDTPDSGGEAYRSARRALGAAGFGPLVAIGIVASVGHIAGQLAMPWIIGRIIDDALVSGVAQELLKTSLWLAAAAAVGALCQGVAKIAFADWGQRSLCALQERMLAHLHRLPVDFLDRQSSGRLNALFTSDATRVATLFDPTLRELIYSLIQSVMLVIVLYRGYGSMIVYAAVLIPIYLAIPLFLTGPVRRLSGTIQESAADAQGLLQEAIDGVRENKVLGDDGWILRRVGGGLTQAARQRVRGVRLRALYGANYVLYWAAIGFIYWQGGLGVLRGDLTIGELVALVSYLGYLE